MVAAETTEAKAATRLVVACLVLALAIGVTDFAAGVLIGRAKSWQATQDPRERVLWDSAHDAPVVLVGDSAFCSYYVDSPSQTLWSRLSSRLGVAVFPGALNGAKPLDMLLIARRVAKVWPAGTIVLIDIHPARVFVPQATQLLPEGRSDRQFRRLTQLVYAPGDDSSRVERVDDWMRVSLADRLFLVRNRDAVIRYLDARLKGSLDWAEDWKLGQFGYRRWDGGDDFARKRFRDLEAQLAAGGVQQIVPFRWVDEMRDALRERGLRPVFVLTPLNSALLRQYSAPGSQVEPVLLASHRFLVGSLTSHRYEFVDLFNSLEPGDFADLIHANAVGEDRLATQVARWLSSGSVPQNPR